MHWCHPWLTEVLCLLCIDRGLWGMKFEQVKSLSHQQSCIIRLFPQWMFNRVNNTGFHPQLLPDLSFFFLYGPLYTLTVLCLFLCIVCVHKCLFLFLLLSVLSFFFCSCECVRRRHVCTCVCLKRFPQAEIFNPHHGKHTFCWQRQNHSRIYVINEWVYATLTVPSLFPSDMSMCVVNGLNNHFDFELLYDLCCYILYRCY